MNNSMKILIFTVIQFFSTFFESDSMRSCQKLKSTIDVLFQN